MTTAVQPHKTGFCIGVTCPGCGGELELQDDFFILACPHCASVLRVVMPEVPAAYLVPRKRTKLEVRPLVDRYCKENGLPLTGSYFQIQSTLYPYWKIDAVRLKVRNTVYEADLNPDAESMEESQTEEREFTSVGLMPFTGSCAAGPASQEIPFTLGVRTDYIRMIPFADQNIGPDENCTAVLSPMQKAVEQIVAGISRMGQLDATSARKNSTELLHPKGSMVFFPYFVVDSQAASKLIRFVVDGVTGRVAGHSILEDVMVTAPASDEEPAKIEFGALGVVPHRCPNCGVDLPATKSYVYQCHNCEHLFFMENNPMLKNELEETSGQLTENDNLVPFWVFHLPLESSSQLQRLFGGIYQSNSILVPGFKMRNLEAMFRLCKRMSSMAPKLSLGKCEKLAEKHLPVTISAEEAMTMVEVIWKREVVGRELGKAKGLAPFSPIAISLLFTPFHSEQYFFVDSISGAVTFERGSLA